MDIYKCPRHVRKHNFKLFTIYTLPVDNYTVPVCLDLCDEQLTHFIPDNTTYTSGAWESVDL